MLQAKSQIPFQTIDWGAIEKKIVAGEKGWTTWKVFQLPGLRIRMVEYSPAYIADHWCSKGHIIYCINGAFESELQTGEKFTLSAGMSYVVSDNASSHRSVTQTGATLLIIDGDFLNVNAG